MSDTDPKGNLVVRIDQDSDTELQALFDSVLKPGDPRKPITVPFHMRKLPKSFFQPPSTGSKSPSVSSISHSRENSGDSAFGPTTATTTATGLQINHSRAHSSPASLQQTYASAQQHQQQQQHLRQRSYDMSTVDELGPLPDGWDCSYTPQGQIYFLNHETRTTTWEDPRKTAAGARRQCHNSVCGSATSSANDLPSLAQQVGNLISVGKSLGGAGASTASSAGSGSGTLSPVGNESALGPLPEGWEQATTPEGEIYFINHITRTTSWFDPRIPAHLQRTPTSPLTHIWMQQPLSQAAQISQQNQRLQNLEVERERLKLRQLEIRQQELKREQQEMMFRQSSRGLDPFLSVAALSNGPTEHTRQESADSGLGMGNNYSLPHTPEDFLASIDDNMDGISEGGSADIGGLEGHEMLSENIDVTDDLVPSLQLEEDFSSDILNDVQSLIDSTSKADSALTWI